MFSERRISACIPSSTILYPPDHGEPEETPSPLRFTFNPMAIGVRGSLIGNAPVERSDPSLFAACISGDEFRLRDIMVRRRLSHESINMIDASGKTALSHVCATGNISILDLLLLIPGVDPNISDNEGNTPLHFAAQAGHADVISRLLQTFPNIAFDSRNHQGITPLMKAALQGKARCVKLLLAAGASPSLRDPGRGFNARDWANFCGRQAAINIIDSFCKIQQRRLSSGGDKWKQQDLVEAEMDLGQYSQGGGVGTSTGDTHLVQKIRRVFRPFDSKRDDYDVARNLVLSTASAALVPNSTPPRRPSHAALQKLPTIPRLQISLCPSVDPSTSIRRMSIREYKRIDHR